MYNTSQMTADRDTLIWYAYRYSTEMGEAAEAVLKAEGRPTMEQAERLYKLLKRDEGRHLSADVYMALLESLRQWGKASELPSRDKPHKDGTT